MKTKFLLGIMLALTLNISNLFSADTIGVLTFQNSKQAEFPTAGEAGADSVSMILMDSKNYTLIERTRLDALLSEQSLGMTGVVNANQAAQLGKVSGCKYIVIGNISELRMTKGVERRTRSTCVTIGCILGGIPGILFGMIVPVKGYIVGLSIKIVETDTGAIKYIGTGTGNDDTLERAVNKAAKRALKKLK